MPRQIDLFSQNLQVTNDPNNQISVTAAQINTLKDQIPAALEAAEKLLLTNILTAIDNATGLDLVDWIADVQAWLNSLSAALQQSWLNFQNLLNGIVQDVDADVAAAVAWLQGVGSAANSALTLLEDFLATGDWSDLSAAYTDLVQAIFGTSTSLGLVGAIPAPAVVDVVQSLQPVWDFPDAASVSAGGQWSWDGTVDHTGTTGSGSAKCAADGTLQGLRGIPGAVQPAQVVTVTAYVMWSGLSTSGSDQIQLQLIPYSTSGTELVAGTPFEVAQVASPGASGSWTELTGTYTVPSSGVDAIQLRLVVTADAAAGSVWFDDCSADVSGGFLADLKADTNSIIDSFAPGGTVGEFQAGVTNLLALFGLTPADVGGATVIDSVWTAVVTDIINPLNALEVQAANIIGDIEIAAINGLASALSALLGTTTFQTLLDSVASALGHSGTGHTIADIETYLGLIPPANVGNVLGGANLGADVSSVQTQASTQNTWWGRLMTDITIYFDLFHGTYPAGSPSDGPTTTVGGVRTWYSAIADVLDLFGIVHSTSTPSTPVSDVGTAVQGTVDAVTSASTGTTQTGTTTADAAAALGGLQNTVTSLSSAVQSLQTTQGGSSQSGSAFAISFNQYTDGAWPSSDWPVTYTGSGSGVLAISGGDAVMGSTNTGNVTAISHYVDPTTSDYQTINATISGLPQGAAKTYACARMNSAMDTYLYAGVYLSGFSLNWELGCYVSGTQHVLASGSGAPLNFSFELKAGVGGDPYRIQGVSGNTVVFDYTDSSHVHTVGSSNRYFGFKSTTDNNGQYVPAPGSYLGCFDSEPPSVIGSGFRRYRSSATAVSQTHTASTNLAFASGFFDTTLEATPDYSFDNGPGVYSGAPGATVANAGWYDVEFRCDIQMAASTAMVTLAMGVLRVNSSATIVETKLLPGGHGLAFNVVGAQSYTSHFSGSGGIYCAAGDFVFPFYYIDGPGTPASLSFLGSADGAHTYWGMKLANWSLN
jgi:hypothetical protein